MGKLYIFVVAVVSALFISSGVYAANSQGSGTQGTNTGTGTGSGIGQGTQGSGTQPVQNQNQVQTQNQGEDQQLQVGTQEQQGAETGQGANGNSQNSETPGRKNGLNSSMSSVAQQVQKLLDTETAAGGIGDQVREWAKEQNMSQIRVQEHIARVESKSMLAKAFFGPNYRSLKEIRQEMELNRVRIQQLEQLKLKLDNEGDIEDAQEMIMLMQQQNTALQERINFEEADTGVFGWLIKLLVN